MLYAITNIKFLDKTKHYKPYYSIKQVDADPNN